MSCSTQVRLRSPQVLFLKDVVGHQFGHHLVFLLELGLECGNPLLLQRNTTRAGRLLKGGRSVLKKLLLPPVEQRWIDAVLLAHLGDGFLLQ